MKNEEAPRRGVSSFLLSDTAAAERGRCIFPEENARVQEIFLDRRCIQLYNTTGIRYDGQVRKMSKAKLSDEVFGTLRRQILLNQLHAGDMLSEAELVERFHVSRTPVRQALQQLSALGLVEIRDGVGTFVTMIAQEDMRDAYQIRLAVEKLAIRTSIGKIPAATLDELEGRFRRFEQLLEKGGYGVSFEELAYADWALHDSILQYSDNRLLVPTMEKITLLLRRYQFAYISGYLRATREHLEIIRNIRAQDTEGVCGILEEHLQVRPL